MKNKIKSFISLTHRSIA